MNDTLSGLSKLRLIYSSDGNVNHAINLATFLKLWSGSKYSKTESVTTVYTST